MGIVHTRYAYNVDIQCGLVLDDLPTTVAIVSYEVHDTYHYLYQSVLIVEEVQHSSKAVGVVFRFGLKAIVCAGGTAGDT